MLAAESLDAIVVVAQSKDPNVKSRPLRRS